MSARLPPTSGLAFVAWCFIPAACSSPAVGLSSNDSGAKDADMTDTGQVFDASRPSIDASVPDAAIGLDAVIDIAAAAEYRLFCDEMLDIMDRRRVECVGGELEDYRLRNTQTARSSFCELNELELLTGRRMYVREAAQTCLAQVRDDSCGALGGARLLANFEAIFTFIDGTRRARRWTVLDACLDVVRGLGRVGDSCLLDFDCGPGTRCHNGRGRCSLREECSYTCVEARTATVGGLCDCRTTCPPGHHCRAPCVDDSCEPVCMPQLQQDENCGGVLDPAFEELIYECDATASLYCSADAGLVCRPRAATDEPCTFADLQVESPCLDASDVCSGRSCRPFVRVGEVCRTDLTGCPALAHCATSTTPGIGRCELLPLVGERPAPYRDYFPQCWPHGWADRRTCAWYRPAGFPCSGDGMCDAEAPVCRRGVCDVRSICVVDR